MSTGGQLGTGVRVGYAIATPHTWVEIPQILEALIPQIERDKVETTIHGVSALRTYIPGLGAVRDAELTLEADLDSSSVHMALQQLERSQASTWFRFQVPRTATLSTTDYFAVQILGRVASWILDNPIDGLKTIKVMIQFEGSYQTQLPMANAF